MKKVLLISIGVLILSACGGDDSADSSDAGKSEPTKAVDSKLTAFLSQEKICDVLPVADIKAMFKIEGEVRARPSGYAQSHSCSYDWDAKDKEAREAAMINNIMANAGGQGKKMTLRERAIDHSINITMSESKKTRANFVPPKLSQQQLDAQIERANEMAAERLTDEQKEVAGDAAADMVAGLLKKNNQNEVVNGVGDAAYWSKVGTGGLYVLDGGVSVLISPMITSSEEMDRDYAQQIYYQIVNNL